MAATTTTTKYRLMIHRAALSSWGDLPSDAQDRFRVVLAECARLRTPSEHEKAALMRAGDGIWRLRIGDYRALCDKHCGEVRVLHVGPRETAYDYFGVAKERSRDE